jgi:hypothetical protein
MTINELRRKLKKARLFDPITLRREDIPNDTGIRTCRSNLPLPGKTRLCPRSHRAQFGDELGCAFIDDGLGGNAGRGPARCVVTRMRYASFLKA